MNSTTYEETMTESTIEDRLRLAAKKMAPVWPLESFVAVNPYMGLIDKKFGNVAGLLSQTAGAKSTMPLSFYLQKIENGEIKKESIQAALEKAGKKTSVDLDQFIDQLKQLKSTEDSSSKKLSTVISTVSQMTGYDWETFALNHISLFASAYFDECQAIWKQPEENSLYATWKKEAEIDRTPDLSGIKGFRATVKQLPETALEAATVALNELGISDQSLDLYLHRALHIVPGWAAFAARVDWDSELYGGKDGVLIEFLAVLLAWEYAFYKCFQSKGIESAWNDAKAKILNASGNSDISEELQTSLLLQNALEISLQNKVIEQFKQANSGAKPAETKPRSKVQSVFCIDVRSEVFRRHFEATDAGVETIGFAGFFAFPIEFVPIGHEKGGTQCPVLLTPAATIPESVDNLHEVVEKRRLSHHIKNAWYSFKMGAISCFSFVGPIGLAYLPKLFTDGFGLTRPVKKPETESLSSHVKEHKKPDVSGIPLDSKIELAAGALNAMSLTSGFARLVMITGHGSTTVNNPHATGLDCGACGGRTGEANARVAADILNEKEVRAALVKSGIEIPEDTFFLSCQHDTTTDEISFFNANELPESHRADIEEIVKLSKEAAKRTRAERSLRMDHASHSNIFYRSKDWSQVRPEWGLAGCANFIAAPRERTENIDLAGRSFLHSYVWQQDKSFGVLELIMTAPMVVASWISLQYYASTVDNKVYGSGNKTIHNVVGTVGVLEGNSGDLRTGLPMQSIHDGENYQHEPVRLNVIIEAPLDEINKIIDRHEMVGNLLDNGWLNLFALNDSGVISHQYKGNLNWETIH